MTEGGNVSYPKVAKHGGRSSDNNNVRTINAKSFCEICVFLREDVRETDRTYLTSENKLNTSMEASLDLFIIWMFKPIVILVAFLQFGFFILFQ